MSLRQIFHQFRKINLRQFANGPVGREPIPVPMVLKEATAVWQKRHAKTIKELLRAKKISEALTYFYREVKVPNQRLYSVLLSAVGNTGHSNLAFKLYKEMRAYQIAPTPAVLTSLFNSCANNQDNRRVASAQANSLYEQISLKGWRANQITYHAMMKAFAMHGDSATCFKILDEMISRKEAINADTYNHLLMACISDKQMGFVLAVRVMRLMLWCRIKPSVECFNALLRSAKECGCGDDINVLNKLLNDAKTSQLKDPKVLQIVSGDSLLDVRLDDSLVSVAAVPKDVSEKIALIGGVQGVLKQMNYFELTPTSTTYSMMLRCISSEDELLEFIKSIPKKKLDIGFWNQLLKKCIVEKYECVDEIEDRLHKCGLSFDIITYGILAMRVQRPESLATFLDRLERKGIVPNEVIMSTLINNICRNFRLTTLLKLLNFCKEHDIAINKAAVKTIAKMLNSNKHAGVNAIVERVLKDVRVLDSETKPRTLQFEPEIFKRNKKRWDPEANDEEIEEGEKKLQQEAELRKTREGQVYHLEQKNAVRNS